MVKNEPWSKRVWYVAALIALLSLMTGHIIAILVINIISLIIITIISITLKRKESKVLIQPPTSTDTPIQEDGSLIRVQYRVQSNSLNLKNKDKTLTEKYRLIEKQQNKDNVQKIVEPGSYVFLIFPTCVSVFLVPGFISFMMVAIPEVIGFLLLLFGAFFLLVILGTLKFYRVEGKKSFFISNESIQMELPLKSLEEIKWADFDEISIVARGASANKDYASVKINFIGSSEFIKSKKFKFRFHSEPNASELMKLIETYATIKNVLVKIDKKDIF